MNKLLLSLAISLISVSAQATIINFASDTTPFVTTLDGFAFSGGLGSHSWANGKFFHNGVATSSPYGYAWSAAGTDLYLTEANGGTFAFDSVSLYGKYENFATITGYLKGSVNHTYSTNLTPGAYTNFSLGWGNVDRVVISNPHTNLFVSDLTVTPNVVPEPASIALLGLGMLGFVAARRKSRQ